MVACRPVSMAILSLVPTPSLAATRIGSLKPAALEVEQRAEAAEVGIGARPPRRLGQRLDGLHQGVAGIDVDAGIAVGDGRAVVPAALAWQSRGGAPNFRPNARKDVCGHSRPGRESVGSGAPRRWMPLAGEGGGWPRSGKPGIGCRARHGRCRPGCCAALLARRAAGGARRAPPDAVFTVANYPVEARADNAVAAKDRALADGQQAAFRSLLKRLVPVTAYRAHQAAGRASRPAT